MKYFPSRKEIQRTKDEVVARVVVVAVVIYVARCGHTNFKFKSFAVTFRLREQGVRERGGGGESHTTYAYKYISECIFLNFESVLNYTRTLAHTQKGVARCPCHCPAPAPPLLAS